MLMLQSLDVYVILDSLNTCRLFPKSSDKRVGGQCGKAVIYAGNRERPAPFKASRIESVISGPIAARLQQRRKLGVLRGYSRKQLPDRVDLCGQREAGSTPGRAKKHGYEIQFMPR